MKRWSCIAVCVIAAVFASAASAQKPIIYPAKKQSAGQQKKDDTECLAWAKTNTGIDPAIASQPVQQETGPAVGGGERVRGAARGAVGGADEVEDLIGRGQAVGLLHRRHVRSCPSWHRSASLQNPSW